MQVGNGENSHGAGHSGASCSRASAGGEPGRPSPRRRSYRCSGGTTRISAANRTCVTAAGRCFTVELDVSQHAHRAFRREREQRGGRQPTRRPPDDFSAWRRHRRVERSDRGGGAIPDADAVRTLAAMQRGDGGWSQLSDTESDACATGQVLYALNTAGRMSASDPVYRKGVDFLLGTQAEDGTWRVKTRAIWLQPYFESGFPDGRRSVHLHGRHGMAAMALAAARPPPLAQS